MNPIVMPCRNGLELTKKAIASCRAQTVPTELMVIDNGSDDGTSQWLWANQIAYIHMPEKSVAAMWNAGIRWAFAQGAEHCLVVNNDVVLHEITYEPLLAHGGEFVTGVGIRPGQGEQALMNPLPSESPHPDFSCFLIRKSAWEKTGAFDERYAGAYAEDCDYHVRMHRAGVRAVSINVPFLHHGAATLRNSNPREQAAIKRQADLNRKLFRETYGCEVGTPEYEALFTSSEAVEAL